MALFTLGRALSPDIGGQEWPSYLQLGHYFFPDYGGTIHQQSKINSHKIVNRFMFVRITTRIGRILQRVEEGLLSASILTIAGLTILNVVCRSVFNFSLAFVEEVSQFCIIVVCFVGLSYAASKGRHIRMTAVYDQLPQAVRKVFMVVITASTAAIMFALAWYAVSYVATVYQLGGIYPALRVPFYVIYAFAPLGLFLAGMQYALAAIRNLTSREIYLSFEKKDEYEQPVTQEI